MIGQTNAFTVSSGPVTTGEYKVKVIDYDGSIIDEQYLNLNDTYTLPEGPTHPGLVFQGWSSPYQITDGKITVLSDVIAGAVYTTASGKNEFDITLNVVTGLTFTLNMDGTKNWGDGTTDTNTSHTYSDYGNYTITCDGTSTGSTYLFNQSEEHPNCSVQAVRLATVSTIGSHCFGCSKGIQYITLSNTVTTLKDFIFGYVHSLRALVLPPNVSMNVSSDDYRQIVQGCRVLKDIVIPYGILCIPIQFMQYCYAVEEIILPPTVRDLYNSCFDSCFSLKKITCLGVLDCGTSVFGNDACLQDFNIPNMTNQIYGSMFINDYRNKEVLEFSNISQIGEEAFAYNLNTKKIIFNNNVTNVSAKAFTNCYNVLEYNFVANTSVPTLANTNAFTGINDLCKIKVPPSLYQSWKSATNWSTYANYIYGGLPSTINFVGDNYGNIYVDGTLIEGTSTSWTGTTMPYYSVDTTNNIIIPPQVKTGIMENTTVNITLSLSPYNKLTLSTGVSGLNSKFDINDVTFNGTDNNGNYYINVVGGNTTISYNIDGGSNYMDAFGTVYLADTDMTESITMVAATEQEFTRPNLSANGTLGGDSFAVNGWTTQASNYAPYRAVDSSSSTYWTGLVWSDSAGKHGPRFVFYNPNPLKVTQLVMTYNNYGPGNGSATLQVSNDNSNWEYVDVTYSLNSTTGTMTVTSPKYYYYYKVGFGLANENARINLVNLNITATEKIATN